MLYNDGDSDAREGEGRPRIGLAGRHAQSIEDENRPTAIKVSFRLCTKTFRTIDQMTDAIRLHPSIIFNRFLCWSTSGVLYFITRLLAINWRRCAEFMTRFPSILPPSWRLSWWILIFTRYTLTNYPWLICATKRWDAKRSRIKKAHAEYAGKQYEDIARDCFPQFLLHRRRQ